MTDIIVQDKLNVAEVEVKNINNRLVTTSRNIAQVFNKRHADVLRDVKNLIDNQGNFIERNFALNEYKDPIGRTLPEYLITKDGVTLLVMGYTGEKAMQFKIAYINKFNDMEKALNGGRVPNFADPIAMAREWADQQEKLLLAEKQRDDAIKTKAWIGSKREATAMNTASRLSRENEMLLTEIGNSKTYKTVKAIPWLKNYFALSKGTYIQIGRKLSALSERMGVNTLQIEDSNYGEVKGYHVSVINKFKELVDNDNTYLNKYRLAD